MFEAEIYLKRRGRLKEQLKSGLILFLGHEESPMNYSGNTYYFRQDSSFLYFFGLDSPSLAGIVDVDENQDILFGDDVNLDDIIWMGVQPLMKVRASRVGIEKTEPFSKLDEKIKQAIKDGRTIHYLPPYRAETELKIMKLFDYSCSQIKENVSEELIKAVVEQRSVKIKEEIDEIEKAHDLTYAMHTTAMKNAKSNLRESDLVGKMEGKVISHGCHTSFPTILTINGQILHNHYHGNVLKEGRLIVNDSGAESQMHYAADITRTFPVGGKFSDRQKEIYEIVLRAQETAIQNIKPGLKFKEIHLNAAQTIAEGLSDLGLIKGDVNEAVKEGAHSLFFPHGLGHMMGLDVHDMENLGENYVGYDEETKRSEQFGLASLRFAKELKPGYVMTVEPGIYFIPALIDKWKGANKLPDFIDYEKIEEYRDFGGIRIEDDVEITSNGCRVIGKPIPKQIEEVEEITATE